MGWSMNLIVFVKMHSSSFLKGVKWRPSKLRDLLDDPTYDAVPCISSHKEVSPEERSTSLMVEKRSPPSEPRYRWGSVRTEMPNWQGGERGSPTLDLHRSLSPLQPRLPVVAHDGRPHRRSEAESGNPSSFGLFFHPPWTTHKGPSFMLDYPKRRSIG